MYYLHSVTINIGPILDYYYTIIVTFPADQKWNLTKSTDPVTCCVEFESSCQSNCNRRCGHTFYNDAKEEQHENQLSNANVHSDIIWKGTAGNPELAIALLQW